MYKSAMMEINTQEAFKAWMKNGARPAAALQGIDLRECSEDLKRTDFTGSIFLSCILSPRGAKAVFRSGGLVIPDSPKFRFPAHRSKLYSVEELFAGYDHSHFDGYNSSYDYAVYMEYMRDGVMNVPLDTDLYRHLHDHSITNALHDILRGRKVVAIMGGHGLERASSIYVRIAKLSRELTRKGFLMASGGGPGAMEATHLGAYFATRPESDLEKALLMLSPRPADGLPEKEYKDPDWLHRAWSVREAFPLSGDDKDDCMSVGIPTWFYGHEPPAPFATHIAKYFANSIREDGLLMMAHYGVIFAPGSAGTRQEIFQDAAQNHYRSAGFPSPMVFFGQDYWTGKSEHRYSFPVWQLVTQTAGEHYRSLMHITDDETEIIKIIENFAPPQS